jgi:hypothetical protein
LKSSGCSPKSAAAINFQHQNLSHGVRVSSKQEIRTMLRFLSHPRFLAVYSGILTIVFAFTVFAGLFRSMDAGGREALVPGWPIPLHRVSAAEQLGSQSFDQITVHRINIVEPDGTPRLIISDKAEYPGSYFKGKELPRPDRTDVAGMLFMNDEGTENGGLIFGGHQSPDGKLHSFGHLSFDEYEQDQTIQIDTSQDGDDRETGYQINDNDSTLFTPELFAELQRVRAMPDGPEKDKARAAFAAKYPIHLRARAGFARLRDKSSEFALSDPEGHIRILLRVAADGTPTMQFLDAAGKVAHQWPDTK